MTSCVRTFSRKSNNLKNNRARPKSSKPTRSSETPKPTSSSPSQTTSVTSWCTTRESLILPLSKPIPTDIKPDRLKQEEREMLHTWKNAIYEDVIHTVKNVSDWLLFKDKQDLPKLLRALRRRDLPTLAQIVQTSSRFYTICENCDLFEVEPLLWDMVCHDTQESQAGRL